MKDAIYTVAVSLCGIGFYFTIIGVLALPTACLSLVLFSTLVVSAWIFQPDDTFGWRTDESHCPNFVPGGGRHRFDMQC